MCDSTLNNITRDTKGFSTFKIQKFIVTINKLK